MDVFGAVMLIDCSTAAVTLRAMEFDVTPPCVALTFAEPTILPVARPDAFSVTAVEFDDDHVTEFVRFCVLPSLNVPVAVN